MPGQGNDQAAAPRDIQRTTCVSGHPIQIDFRFHAVAMKSLQPE